MRYNDEALKHPELALALTMPPRPEGYKTNRLTPILAMTLPEGFLLDRVLDRYRKVIDVADEMNLLAVTSTSAAGRVWVSAAEEQDDGKKQGMTLRDILAYPGTEDLFEELLDKYATASISGVQPKVLVPERTELASLTIDKSAVKSPDLIVKAAGAEFPGLAENEFICMSIARHIALETPDFWLSEDGKLFVVRRFDVGSDGYLGFEDLAALTGRHPSEKYDGSYHDVARAVGDFCAPLHRAQSLSRLFRLIVLSCVLRNGDAHLKNFGLLYSDPKHADDARLSPVYDLINSTMYLPKDVLALSLNGSKRWPDRKALEAFGRNSCELERPGHAIDEILDQVTSYKYERHDSSIWERLQRELRLGIDAIKSERPVRRQVHRADVRRPG